MRALTIEQMKVLKEKGLDYSKAASLCLVNIFYIDEYGDKVIIRKNALIDFDEGGEIYPNEIDVIQPTLTLEDILKILPLTIGKKGYARVIYPTLICYEYHDDFLKEIDINDNLIDAAYEMLLWCLDNKYI